MGKSEPKTNLLAILDNAPFMAWYKDADGRFVAINQPFADYIGKPREEIIGKTDYDFRPHEFAAGYAGGGREVMRTRAGKTAEEKIDAAGGAWLETFESPVFDAQGNVVGTVGMTRDISAPVRFQQALEDQKRLFKSMIDASPDLIFYKDVNSVYLGCNKAYAEEFIGKTEEEVVGKTGREVMNDLEMAAFCLAKDREVFSAGRTLVAEEKIRLANGEVAEVETAKTPFYNKQGELAGLIGISRDITARKKAEAQMKESEMRLNLAISNTNIGMWDCDIKTGATVFNEQWANMIGYTLAELAPIDIATWRAFTHPDDLVPAEARLNDYLSGAGDFYESEIRMKHRDGRWIWFLDRGRVIERDADGKALRMVGTHIDITARKQAEEELRNKDELLSAVAVSIRELIENRDYLAAAARCFELIGTAARVDRVCLYANHQDAQGNWFASQAVRWQSAVNGPQTVNPEMQNLPFKKLDAFIKPLLRGEAFYGTAEDMDGLCANQNILSVILLPVIVRGTLWGAVGFDECKYVRRWSDSEYAALSAFAHSLGKTIERSLIESELAAKNIHLQEAYDSLEVTAATDALTQLLNRREMRRRLEYERVKFTRNKRPFSIVIADIDEFKKVNDTYGHLAGDEVLAAVAKILRGNTRQADSVARWGGEEFLLLLPETPAAGAAVLAEKVRRAIEGNTVAYGKAAIRVTMTFGVCEFKGSGLDELIAKADRALYEGKAKGRNCTVIFGG